MTGLTTIKYHTTTAEHVLRKVRVYYILGTADRNTESTIKFYRKAFRKDALTFAETMKLCRYMQTKYNLSTEDVQKVSEYFQNRKKEK